MAEFFCHIKKVSQCRNFKRLYKISRQHQRNKKKVSNLSESRCVLKAIKETCTDWLSGLPNKMNKTEKNKNTTDKHDTAKQKYYLKCV